MKVSPDFHFLSVFWLAQGDENDAVIDRVLKTMAGPLRHELSQLRLMGEVPRICFVKDKYYSKAAEVDILLKKADFGDDFVPTDPTIFMKAEPQLQMALSNDERAKIHQIEETIAEDDLDEEEELPQMRHDVLGLDHSAIMKKISISMDKSKKAWEAYGTDSESIMSVGEPSRDMNVLSQKIEKLNKEADIRADFVKFLERKQFEKRGTPERKKYKNLHPSSEDYHEDDYRDPLPDGDYIDEENDHRK